MVVVVAAVVVENDKRHWQQMQLQQHCSVQEWLAPLQQSPEFDWNCYSDYYLFVVDVRMFLCWLDVHGVEESMEEFAMDDNNGFKKEKKFTRRNV